jgi:hypothetical protein
MSACFRNEYTGGRHLFVWGFNQGRNGLNVGSAKGGWAVTCRLFGTVIENVFPDSSVVVRVEGGIASVGGCLGGNFLKKRSNFGGRAFARFAASTEAAAMV